MIKKILKLLHFRHVFYAGDMEYTNVITLGDYCVPQLLVKSKCAKCGKTKYQWIDINMDSYEKYKKDPNCVIMKKIKAEGYDSSHHHKDKFYIGNDLNIYYKKDEYSDFIIMK